MINPQVQIYSWDIFEFGAYQQTGLKYVQDLGGARFHAVAGDSNVSSGVQGGPPTAGCLTQGGLWLEYLMIAAVRCVACTALHLHGVTDDVSPALLTPPAGNGAPVCHRAPRHQVRRHPR